MPKNYNKKNITYPQPIRKMPAPTDLQDNFSWTTATVRELPIKPEINMPRHDWNSVLADVAGVCCSFKSATFDLHKAAISSSIN